MKYSASDLVKRSAAQIIYLKDKLDSILSRRMLNGEAYQSKIVKDESLSNTVADEMRGCYTYIDKKEGEIFNDESVEIFFCIDMIKNGCFYEIKSVLDEDGNETTEYPDWYLNSSLLQCAFYKSLLLRMNGNKLFTPKFRVREGYKKSAMDVDVNAPYYLIFGTIGTWEVVVNDPDAIIDFFKNKIHYIRGGYTWARDFDGQYKRKEFDLLKEYFTFTKIS